MRRSNIPWGILGIGVLARLVLAPYTAWNNDVSVWYHTSLSGYYGLRLYERPGFSYPPVWGYLLQIIGSAAHTIGLGPDFFGVYNPAFGSTSSATFDFTEVVTSPGFNIAFKSVLFTFDFATALLVYRLVDQVTGDERRARFAFAACFLNPFVIYESAVQGAFDTIVGFSVLATVVLLMDGRYFWAGSAWTLGILTKLSPLILAPLFLVVILGGFRSSTRPRAVQFGLVALGAATAGAVLLAPEAVFGSIPAMLHNVLARTQESVTIGGLSITGVRYLKPFAGLLDWTVQNSAFVIRATSVAQAVCVLGWTAWAAAMGRQAPVFATLAATVGILGTFMLLSPISNPQYVLWWLPALTALVFIANRWYVHLALLTVAPLVFAVAILGPTAVFAPLATYTKLFPAPELSAQVIAWYEAPGKLWGAYFADDYFAPASIVTVVTLLLLFRRWIQSAFAQSRITARDASLADVD
jgi:Glycosyltransferase family 87